MATRRMDSCAPALTLAHTDGPRRQHAASHLEIRQAGAGRMPGPWYILTMDRRYGESFRIP
jgi:hypothetical protein